ncbi:hypothetical protein VSU19_03645 [Verrucomicrobiales bacterium BCK34]|nr:hypothetical protein [Verrucomicrobiales bacterium BCK34]
MRQNTRRHFLKQAGATALATSASPAIIGGQSPLASQEAWTLHGEQFRAGNEYEGGWVQNFTSTVEALPNNRWRIWTSVSVPDTGIKNIGYHEGKIDGEWKPVWSVCTTGKPDPTAQLAIGGMPEGAHPVQVVTIRLQNGLTRLYFWAHGGGVVRYLAADSIDETARQFEVVNALNPCLYHPGDRAVGGGAAKEAGLSRFGKKVAKPIEGEALAPAALISNDATNVYQLADGSFEMFSVTLIEVDENDPRYAPQDNLKGFLRVIDRYTSADGLHWGNRQRVIEADSDDPVDQQCYYLSVTYTEKGRLGMLGSYRLDNQSIDIEPCFSKDGIKWERPQRTPWIPRAEPGEGVASYLIHAPHNLVQRDGRWWLFYTGGNFAHNHKHSHGTPDRAILVASCQDVWGG